MTNELKMLELTGENRSRYWTLRIRQYREQKVMEALTAQPGPKCDPALMDAIVASARTKSDFSMPVLEADTPRRRPTATKSVRESLRRGEGRTTTPRRATRAKPLTVDEIVAAVNGGR